MFFVASFAASLDFYYTRHIKTARNGANKVPKYPWKVRGMKEIMANFHEFMMMDKFSSTFFQFEILLFYELSCLCFDPRKKMSLRWVYSNWDKKFWLQARESRRMFDLVESFGSKTLQPAQHVLMVVVVHSRTFHRFFSLNSERFSE